MDNSFYNRREWKELRYRILRKYGFKCQACGADKSSGTVLHVDHIKPISIHPELALNESNLQVLCKDCNLGKSNKFDDSFVKNTEDKTFNEKESEMLKLFNAKTNDELSKLSGYSVQDIDKIRKDMCTFIENKKRKSLVKQICEQTKYAPKDEIISGLMELVGVNEQ